MHGVVSTVIGDLQAACLFPSMKDACSKKNCTGDLQAGWLFSSMTDAWSSKYINWGFAGGSLIRLYDRCMEQ